MNRVTDAANQLRFFMEGGARRMSDIAPFMQGFSSRTKIAAARQLELIGVKRDGVWWLIHAEDKLATDALPQRKQRRMTSAAQKLKMLLSQGARRKNEVVMYMERDFTHAQIHAAKLQLGVVVEMRAGKSFWRLS